MTDLLTYLQENKNLAETMSPEEEARLAELFLDYKNHKKCYLKKRDGWMAELDSIVASFGLSVLTEDVGDYLTNRAYRHTENPFYRLDVLLNSTRLKPRNPRLDSLFNSYLFSYREAMLEEFLKANEDGTEQLVGDERQRLLANLSSYAMFGTLAEEGLTTDVVLQEWREDNDNHRSLPTAYYLAYFPALANLLFANGFELGRVLGWSNDGMGLFYGDEYNGSDCFVKTPKIGTTLINSALRVIYENEGHPYFSVLDKEGVMKKYLEGTLFTDIDLSMLSISDLLDAVEPNNIQRMKATIERYLLINEEGYFGNLSQGLTADELTDIVKDNANILSAGQLEDLLLDSISYQKIVMQFFDDMVWQAQYCQQMEELQAKMEQFVVRDFLERAETLGHTDFTDYLFSLTEDKETVAQTIYRMTDLGNMVGVSQSEALFLGERWTESIHEQEGYLSEVLEMTAKIGETLYDDSFNIGQTEKVRLLMEAMVDVLAVAFDTESMRKASHEIIA